MGKRIETLHSGKRAPEIPSAANSHISHGFQADKPQTADASLARKAGRGKDVRATPVHGGMTNSQTAGMGRGGLGHGTVDSGGLPVAGNVHPFDKAPSPQLAHGKLAPVKPGMRSRTDYDLC